MLQRVSHHFPYCNEADIAFCGHRREDGERGSAMPGCPFCAEALDAEDRMDEEASIPVLDEVGQ